MQFEAGNNYRAKAIDAQIEKIESTGTVLAEVMLEVTLGPMLGRRIRWRGWLNSDANAKRAVEALRAMGWRGARFGEWTGLGSREIEFQCEIEEKDGKRYPSAAFVRPLAELRSRNAALPAELEGLSTRFGGLLRPPSDAAAPSSRAASAPPPDDDFDYSDADAPPEASQEAFGGL